MMERPLEKQIVPQVLRSDGVLSALARQATYETANKKREDV